MVKQNQNKTSDGEQNEEKVYECACGRLHYNHETCSFDTHVSEHTDEFGYGY